MNLRDTALLRDSSTASGETAKAARNEGEERAVVVLGCAVRWSEEEPREDAAKDESVECAARAERVEGTRALAGAAGRRASAAAREYARVVRARAREAQDGDDAPTIVIAAGGRAWDGIVEADALRDALARDGVPREAIVRERCSHSTRENATWAARLLARRGIDAIALVTCAWHMPRAAALFRAEGLRVREVPAEDAPAGIARRVWRWGRERVAGWKDGVR